MNLRDYLQILRRRLLLVILIVGVVGATTAFVALRQRPSYEATVFIRVRPPAPFGAVSGALQTGFAEQADMGTEATIARSEQVAQAVVDQLHLNVSAIALQREVGASTVSGTSAVLAIPARTRDPRDPHPIP